MTVTTLGTCTTVVLRIVVWTVSCPGVTAAEVSAAGFWTTGTVGVAAITVVMVEASSNELVDVLSKPSLRVIVITETTGDTETITAVEEDSATAATEEEADGSCWTTVVMKINFPEDVYRKDSTARKKGRFERGPK